MASLVAVMGGNAGQQAAQAMDIAYRVHLRASCVHPRVHTFCADALEGDHTLRSVVLLLQASIPTGVKSRFEGH